MVPDATAPPARRSAGLPARPCPSGGRVAEVPDEAASPVEPADDPAAPPPIPAGEPLDRAAPPAPALPPALAAPAAQGGGAAQSRGGFRVTGGSSRSTLSGSSAGSSMTDPTLDDDAIAVGAVSGRSPTPRAWAASRRAQSWKVGQTGNALERQ